MLLIRACIRNETMKIYNEQKWSLCRVQKEIPDQKTCKKKKKKYQQTPTNRPSEVTVLSSSDIHVHLSVSIPNHGIHKKF